MVGDDALRQLIERTLELENRLRRLEVAPVGGGSGGSSTFTGLTDTPSAYTGQAGKFVQVNAGATALEFDSVAWTDVTGKPSTFAPSAHAASHHNAGGDAIDHGSIAGLNDDDHTQYHNDTRGDARYYTKTQLMSNELALVHWGNLTFKPSTFAPSAHAASHHSAGGDAIDHGSIAGLNDDDHAQYHNDARGDARYYTQTQLNTAAAGGAVHWDNVTNVPTMVAISGTPTAGRVVQWASSSSISDSGIVATALARVTGTPVADRVAYWDSAATLADAGFAYTDLARLSQAQTFTGQKTFSADMFVADKIVHDGDTNTAIRFIANDTVVIETNGGERIRVTSAGRVGINTSSPNVTFEVDGTARLGPTGTNNALQIPSNNVHYQFRRSQSAQWPAEDSGLELHVSSGATRKLFMYNQSLAAGFHLLVDGRIGIGTLAPRGVMHMHDGTGGTLQWSSTSVAGSAVTVIPDGTGDVTAAALVRYVVKTGTTVVAGSQIATNGGSFAINIGGEVVTVAVSAGGALTVQRTSGVATYAVVLDLSWM